MRKFQLLASPQIKSSHIDTTKMSSNHEWNECLTVTFTRPFRIAMAHLPQQIFDLVH